MLLLTAICPWIPKNMTGIWETPTLQHFLGESQHWPNGIIVLPNIMVTPATYRGLEQMPKGLVAVFRATRRRGFPQVLLKYGEQLQETDGKLWLVPHFGVWRAWGTPENALQFCPVSEACLILVLHSYKRQGSVLPSACSRLLSRKTWVILHTSL